MMRNIIVDGKVYERQSFGGISRIFSEILPRMCDRDESLQFTIVTTEKLRKKLPRHPRIRHSALDYWEKFLRPGRYFKQIRRRGRYRAQINWWSENRADIWHSTYYTLPVKWQGPVVISAYDLIYERFPKLFPTDHDAQIRSGIRRAVTTADVVICISATTMADIVNLFDVDPDKLYVVPLGISSAFCKIDAVDLIPTVSRPFLLYVGNRTGYKNFFTLLHAYSIWPANREIDLLVVGKPWTKEEMKQIKELGVAGKVHLTTAVPDQELARLYNEATAFVFPSLYEGFGLPLLEAMSCGCPVVASKIPTSEEVAGDAAYYFEPESSEDMREALDKAVSGGRSVPNVQLGQKRAATYSWDKTAQSTIDIYHALL